MGGLGGLARRWHSSAIATLTLILTLTLTLTLTLSLSVTQHLHLHVASLSGSKPNHIGQATIALG